MPKNHVYATYTAEREKKLKNCNNNNGNFVEVTTQFSLQAPKICNANCRKIEADEWQQRKQPQQQ